MPTRLESCGHREVEDSAHTQAVLPGVRRPALVVPNILCAAPDRVCTGPATSWDPSVTIRRCCLGFLLKMDSRLSCPFHPFHSISQAYVSVSTP